MLGAHVLYPELHSLLGNSTVETSFPQPCPCSPVPTVGCRWGCVSTKHSMCCGSHSKQFAQPAPLRRVWVWVAGWAMLC